ncbi:MAG: hypothetical protein Q9166_001980 [cf. Caloplaca sp. 2 TL-2023]
MTWQTSYIFGITGGSIFVLFLLCGFIGVLTNNHRNRRIQHDLEANRSKPEGGTQRAFEQETPVVEQGTAMTARRVAVPEMMEVRTDGGLGRIQREVKDDRNFVDVCLGEPEGRRAVAMRIGRFESIRRF